MQNIFRPLKNIEDEQYSLIKNKVFNNFAPGHYTNLDEIISVCSFIYNEHEKVLKENVSKLSTLSLIEFILNQYDKYSQVNKYFHENLLGSNEEIEWLHYASHSRRGIKYLCEYLCQFHTQISTELKLQASIKSDLEEESETLSRIFISIEEMCSTYIRIDSYKYLYDEVELILDEKKFIYFTVPQDLDPKNHLDIRNEKREILKLIYDRPYAHNIKDHSKTLESSFNQHLGICYEKIINFLMEVISSSVGAYNFIKKSDIISDLSCKHRIDIKQATDIIHGFSIRPINLETRRLFNPKQEHRAYHRGFFEFMDNDIPILIYSKQMAIESLDILINNICYQKLPEEWKTREVELQLTTLSNKAGKWFEELIRTNLIAHTPIKSIHSVKTLHSHGKTIKLPSNVGEIDFIGYSAQDSSIFIIEAKNVRFTTEPKLFRDDLSKFISGKKSYSEKFIVKCQWVKDNLNIVTNGLKKRGVKVGEVKHIFFVMIILSPSPIEDKITEFSCVNLVKFIKTINNKDYSSLVSYDL